MAVLQPRTQRLTLGSTQSSRQRKCQQVPSQRATTRAAAVQEDENHLTAGADGIWRFASTCGAGTVLATAPQETWLTTDVVESSNIGAATQGCAPWVRMALYLIHADMTSDSQWGSYLQQAVTAPFKPAVLWSDDDLDLLRGTQVYGTVMQYRQFFSSQHADLEGVLAELGSDMQAACTPERFQLAAATVRARLLPAFPMDKPCLVPGSERLIHSRSPTVSVSIKTEGLFKKTEMLQFQATGSAAAGDALSLDFAPGKLESQVALDYGMYDVRSPQMGFLLALSLPCEEEDACHYDKLDIAEENGMAGTQTFTLKQREAPPPDMLAFLRLMNIQGTDAFLMESIFRNEAWGHMMEPVSKENEQAVCDSMVAGCEAALAGFSTTLADDIRALDETGEEVSEKGIALHVRSEEKKILEGIAEWFRQRAASIDELEYYQERRLKRLGLLDDDGTSTFEDMVQINV